MNWFFPAMMMLSGIMQSAAMAEAGQEARRAAQRNAAIRRAQGEAAARDEREMGRRVAGAQRAARASQGVALGRGTPLDTLAQVAARAELNALRAQWGYEQRAEMQEWSGAQAERAANIRSTTMLAETGFNAYNLGLLGGTSTDAPENMVTSGVLDRHEFPSLADQRGGVIDVWAPPSQRKAI